jgi:hypothetical protein
MVRVKPEQIYGLLGHLAFGVRQGRSDECMDQFTQRRGVYNGIQFLKHHGVKPCKLLIQETFGTIEPLLALVLMVALGLRLTWIGERLVGPSQHQCISGRWRDKGKQCGMEGCGLFNRGEALVKMGSHRLKPFRQHGIIDLGAQTAQECELGADACARTEPTTGGTQVQGVAEQMEQESELLVACPGWLTRGLGVCIALERLVQMGLAFGVVEWVRGCVLLGQGGVSFALQWAAPVQEVLQCMTPLTHPACVLARRVITRHETQATIGGHADAVEAMSAHVVTRGFPGLGRALRGSLHLQHGRAVRRNRDQEGLMAGQNLIPQIKHPGGLCQRQGRRQSPPGVLEACTELSYGIGLGLDVLYD